MSTTDSEIRHPAAASSRSVDAVAPAEPVTGAGDPRPRPDTGRENEKRGLVEALLERERYRSILEFGCGTGELARLLVRRCDTYTGVDADTAALCKAHRLARTRASMHFVPLALPLGLPSGEHELVVLSEILQLLDPPAVLDLAQRLDAHAPCCEIIVIGASDEHAGGRDAALEAFVAALDDAFEYQELAVRRHYRIDALLRRSGSSS